MISNLELYNKLKLKKYIKNGITTHNLSVLYELNCALIIFIFCIISESPHILLKWFSYSFFKWNIQTLELNLGRSSARLISVLHSLFNIYNYGIPSFFRIPQQICSCITRLSFFPSSSKQHAAKKFQKYMVIVSTSLKVRSIFIDSRKFVALVFGCQTRNPAKLNPKTTNG